MKTFLRLSALALGLCAAAAACNPNVIGGGDGGDGGSGGTTSTGGCFGPIYEWCEGGVVHGECCAPGACASPPEYCDLGNATCYLGPCTDADAGPPPCETISASSFDQTCQSDTDCVGAFEGDLCSACLCQNATINRSALPAYNAVLNTAGPHTGVCNCPAAELPVCDDGVCTLP